MRSRYRIHEPDAAHFITSTITEWLPVFTSAACCDVLIRSFDHCRQHKCLRIHAWVILDNHFHAIVSGLELADTIRDFKRFTARMLLAQLQEERREWLLNQLSYFRAAHRKAVAAHHVWQEAGVSARQPGEAGMVASPEHWRYSSAHEGMAGTCPVLRCDPWR